MRDTIYYKDKGPVTYVRTELYKPDHRHAAYVRLLYQDVEGKEWYFLASSFWYEFEAVSIE